MNVVNRIVAFVADPCTFVSEKTRLEISWHSDLDTPRFLGFRRCGCIGLITVTSAPDLRVHIHMGVRNVKTVIRDTAGGITSV